MNHVAQIEAADQIAHIRRHGLGRLVEAMADPRLRTRGGRVILSRLARRLRVTEHRAAAMLAEARRLAGP